ncbi:MAG: Alkaline phosphatase synthesis transcriptional regulatory protein PhoP [Anaerolineae bacterium]|nr:Alkaline phosphatase synthesis transcriptional regulatory protein PhoP [Anaerolineae bacterium]
MESNTAGIDAENEIKSILIVEDDDVLRQTLAYNLEKEGYTVYTAADGAVALEQGRAHEPDLIVLDIMLPVLDGLSVCRILRREIDALIIMLSARANEVDKIVGLDAGADDYLTKPFSLGELLARVRAVLRRQPKPPPDNRLESDDLTVDLIGRKVHKGEKELTLTFKEFDLLAELMRNRGMVLSRDLLVSKVWGYDNAGDSRTVDVHIRWLREKIEENPSKPRRITTIQRIGYRFER